MARFRESSLGVVLSFWVIYDHPRDYPDHYLARRWEIVQSKMTPTDDTIVNLDLYRIRGVLAERGLRKVPRFEGDDPCIVETWV